MAAFLLGHCHAWGAAAPYLPVLEILRSSCGIARDRHHRGRGGQAGGRHARHEHGGRGARRARAVPRHEDRGRAARRGRPAGVQGPDVRGAPSAHDPPQPTGSARPAARGRALDRSRAPRSTSPRWSTPWSARASSWCARIAPGYRPPWIDKSFATQMALQPLGREDGLSLARASSGAQTLDATLLETIAAKAEGNPFFVEELVRAVREQGGESTAAVPATIEEVLRSRLDRLESAGSAAAAACRRHRPSGPAVGARGPRRRAPRCATVRARATLERGVPLRAAARIRARVLLQAHPHARGGVREPRGGGAARAARPGRGGHRARADGAGRRGRRTPRAPRLPRWAVGQGRRVSAGSGRPRRRARRASRGGGGLRAGAGRARPPADRALDRGHRSSLRPADLAPAARRAPADLRRPAGGGSDGGRDRRPRPPRAGLRVPDQRLLHQRRPGAGARVRPARAGHRRCPRRWPAPGRGQAAPGPGAPCARRVFARHRDAERSGRHAHRRLAERPLRAAADLLGRLPHLAGPRAQRAGPFRARAAARRRGGEHRRRRRPHL